MSTYTTRLDQARNVPIFNEDPEEGCGHVYKLTPIVSDSASNGYIGITTQSVWKRMQSHIWSSSFCRGVKNAIDKHTIAGLVVEILLQNVPIDNLLNVEVQQIALFDTHKNGYNCTPGGDFNPMDDPAVRDYHLKRVKEVNARPEVREKHSQGNLRVWAREEDRKQRIDSMNAVRNTEAFKAKHKASMTFHSDPEYRKKIGTATAARLSNPEEVKKLSDAIKNKHKDEEYKQKVATGVSKSWDGRRETTGTAISVALKRKIDTDPEYRKRRAATAADPKVRKNRSNGCKAAWAERKKDPDYKAKQEAARKAGWEKRRANAKKA